HKAASARGLTRPELLNVMPYYLAALAHAGPAWAAEENARQHHLIERHLAARLRQGFQLPEILEEIELLGRVITSTWADAPPEERPDAPEIARLFLDLHQASVRVSEMFTEHLLEDEQAEKRYRRLIQNITQEALGRSKGKIPPRARLEEIL